MKLLLISLSLAYFVSACGVNTSSSVSTDERVSGEDTTGVDDGDVVVPPIVDDETNTSVDDDVVVVLPPNEDQEISIFDTSGAVKDQSACIINSTFNFIKDSSFDPLSTSDELNAVEISSKYDYNSDIALTEVAMFYPNLTKSILSKNVTVYETDYRFGFDEAWVANTQRTIYVRTPKIASLYYGCYRYTLDSTDAGSITATKVYRVNE